MKPRIAIVHDWLIHMRGGEKVLEALYEVFPEADIHTLFFRKDKLSPVLQKATIRGSILNVLPGIAGFYRWLLPFMPLAIKTLKLSGYDIVVSISHCVAKACPVPKEALHICYCLTPMRYVWGYREDYFSKYPAPLRSLIHWCLDRFKKWDVESNDGVDTFITDCENIRKRVETTYGRDSFVIYPPVETGKFGLQEASKIRGYYLFLSALVPYKRADLAVEAFNRMQKPLLVLGDGPELAKLKSMAGPSVRFLSGATDDQVREAYAACRALLFPGEEDFGIVPVEAQACGRPVIAYAKGGALETVNERTGVFFSEQSADSLIDAVIRFEKLSFDPAAVRENAMKFDRKIFQQQMREAVERLYRSWSEGAGKAAGRKTHSVA